ncbi:MAG TPA: DMT family transporter [Solirubrobacterales bacterium]|nr:DMT family transporter [Solirubrobacterales bacterium]
MLGLSLSLASAASWGISDFLGGLQTRRLPVLAVLAVSQPAGLVLIAILIALIGADSISAGKLAIAFLAGAASLGGLAAFYSAMAMGTVSVVAPIASLGVVVPVVIGLAEGESPAAVQLAGLVPAIAGVVVLSYEEQPERVESARAARLSIVLAVVAGLGFGVFFTGLDAAAADRPGWAILAVRVGGVATVLVALLATRPRFDGVAAAWPVLIVIGAFDVLANALFAIASTKGVLPVVAVGGSMYPAFTVALAHGVLGERLATLQWMGVILALAGVAMIAAGG